MLILELNKVEYIFPNSWMDINIEQLQQITVIENSELDEIDKTIELANILSGINKDELYDIPFTEFKKVQSILSFINKDFPEKSEYIFEYKGKKYYFECDVTTMTTSEYIDLDELTKMGPESLHLCMAILFKEKNEKYNKENLIKKSEIFKKHMPASFCLSSMAFTVVLSQIYIQNSPDYSIIKKMMEERLKNLGQTIKKEEMMNLYTQINGDGK